MTAPPLDGITVVGDGPWVDRRAYDLLAQAETGVVSLTGTPGSSPRWASRSPTSPAAPPSAVPGDLDPATPLDLGPRPAAQAEAPE